MENVEKEIKIEVVNGEGVPVEDKPNESIKESAKDLGDKLKERGGDVLEHGLQAADNLQKTAAPYVAAFGSAFKAGVTRFKEKISEHENSAERVAEKIKDGAEHTTEKVKETVEHSREKLADMVDEAPLPDDVKKNLNKDL